MGEWANERMGEWANGRMGECWNRQRFDLNRVRSPFTLFAPVEFSGLTLDKRYSVQRAASSWWAERLPDRKVDVEGNIKGG